MTDRIEIESLFRLKLSHFKPIIDKAKEVQALPIEQQLTARLRWEIKYTLHRYLEEIFPLEVELYFSKRLGGEITDAEGRPVIDPILVLRWESPDGLPKEKELPLLSRESNLGKGYKEYYFYCSGLCRTLYSDRRGIYSRDQIRHRVIYKQQKESRVERTFSKHLRADNILSDLYENHRHLFYKGRLTPFGKQAQKAHDLRAQDPDIYATLLVPKKRGRKPKAAKAQRRNYSIY